MNLYKEAGILATAALGTAIGLAVPGTAKAQLPFYTGQRNPNTYAIETRLGIEENDGFTNETYGKTFREELPLWIYMQEVFIITVMAMEQQPPITV